MSDEKKTYTRDEFINIYGKHFKCGLSATDIITVKNNKVKVYSVIDGQSTLRSMYYILQSGKKWNYHGRHVIYNKNGWKNCVTHYNNGNVHRVDGPAEICYYMGIKVLEKYYQNGVMHRSTGPAYIAYEPHGLELAYYIHGECQDAPITKRAL